MIVKFQPAVGDPTFVKAQDVSLIEPDGPLRSTLTMSSGKVLYVEMSALDAARHVWSGAHAITLAQLFAEESA